MKKTAKKKKWILTAALCIVGLPLLAIGAIRFHYRGIRLSVTKEYGTAPCAADFTDRNATLDSYDEKPAIGKHKLILRVAGIPTPVYLYVTDTVAPAAEPVDQVVPAGKEMRPDAFVKHIRDADRVKISFAEQPDFNSEWDGTVRIVLEDGSGNSSTVPVHVTVCAVIPSVTVEAGADAPDVREFLYPGVEGTLDTPITAEMLHHAGTYPIAITTATGVKARSELTVVDTVAPRVKAINMIQLKPGETVAPEDFLIRVSDETDIRLTFAEPPDYECRELQSVILRATDEGGNVTDAESMLFITGIEPKLIEARRDQLSQSDFDHLDGQTVTFDPFVPDTPGSYVLHVSVNGIPETYMITVVDTTPPVITQKPLPEGPLYTRHGLCIDDLFEASDLSGAELTFAEGTDLDRAGEQQITVIARDPYGNESTASRIVNLLEDRNPPRLYGVINRICYVGEPIAYLSEVFAEDDEDGRTDITVESGVMPYEEGTYTVVYHAEDLTGNYVEERCTFTVIQRTVTEEELRAMAKSIMAEITTPEMVDAEKLKAIFDYVQSRIRYANGVNRNYTDWRKAAYDGYTMGVGDCYNIYSLTRALLDETDIRYLSVERVKTHVRRTRHYWVHVNLGTGWYVFDPTWTPKHKVNCFMWTKKQCDSCRLYWNYDESLYPPLSEEPFDYDAVVLAERKGQMP